MNTCTIEWAWVPFDAIPSSAERPTFEDPAAPPMMAARDAGLAFCARRMPNSSTAPPWAASATRDAFVAMSVGKLRWWSNPVSRSWATSNGACTTVIGVLG